MMYVIVDGRTEERQVDYIEAGDIIEGRIMPPRLYPVLYEGEEVFFESDGVIPVIRTSAN